MEWGRKNERYLLVRKDLPDWPAAGKIDGNAHVIDDSGLVFLFNPNPEKIAGHFRLNKESIGLTNGHDFQISQSYPVSDTKREFSFGQEVSWEVPASTAVVLKITPLNKQK